MRRLAYINCDEVKEMQTAFVDFSTDRLIRVFSALSGVVIKPESTLIVFS